MNREVTGLSMWGNTMVGFSFYRLPGQPMVGLSMHRLRILLRESNKSLWQNASTLRRAHRRGRFAASEGNGYSAYVTRKYQGRIGRRQRDDGYVDVWQPNHPLARRDGYVFEHRKMAWDAGLLIDPVDQVHHVNEVRNDNRLSNFEIKDGSTHTLDHAEERGHVTNQHGTFAVKPRHLRSSAPRPERDCEGCGNPISLSLRRDARYCSESCRINSWRRSHR